MIARCIFNDISSLLDPTVFRRLSESIRLDGPDSDLVIGTHYPIQAIETRKDRSLWIYLHTAEMNDYPYPYPVEFFLITNSTIPENWKFSPSTTLFRIAFPEWAEDDHFFERLVDGDPKTIEIYNRNRSRY